MAPCTYGKTVVVYSFPGKGLVAMLQDTPILLAESDPHDVALLRHAFAKAGIHHPLVVVDNGKDAIDYLGRQGIYSDAEKYPWPCLILLDLNMPVVDGMEVLAWRRTQQHLSEIPIIVLTGSVSDSEVQKVLDLGATDWRHKPHEFDDLIVLCQEIRFRWLSSSSPVIAHRSP